MTKEYEVKEERAESVLTAVIRSHVRRNELSRFVPAACGEVWSFVRSANLRQPGRNLALYLPNGVVEVGVEVSERFADAAKVICSELPAGRVAHAIHFGPYGGLSGVHAAIRNWCAERGHSPTVSWELYGHWQERWNAEPALIRTDVFYLLDAQSS